MKTIMNETKPGMARAEYIEVEKNVHLHITDAGEVPMFVNAFSKDNYSWRPKTRITFYRLSSMGRLHSKKLFPVLSEW